MLSAVMLLANIILIIKSTHLSKQRNSTSSTPFASSCSSRSSTSCPFSQWSSTRPPSILMSASSLIPSHRLPFNTPSASFTTASSMRENPNGPPLKDSSTCSATLYISVHSAVLLVRGLHHPLHQACALEHPQAVHEKERTPHLCGLLGNRNVVPRSLCFGIHRGCAFLLRTSRLQVYVRRHLLLLRRNHQQKRKRLGHH